MRALSKSIASRRLPFALVLFATLAGAMLHPADAAEGGTITTREVAREHPNPRFALSYRRFSIGDLSGSPITLHGGQIDLHAMSGRWVRGGFELEGGVGQTTMAGRSVDLAYGLFGATAGLQYPARITPFIEGRIAAGALVGAYQGMLAPGGASGFTLPSTTIATWIYGGGIDAGIALYTIGRAYFCGSIGWLRTTWHSVDPAAILQDPLGGVRFRDLTADSFTFKVGLGV